MEEDMEKYVVCVTLMLASLSTVRAQQIEQPDPQTTETAPDWHHERFEVSSTTFKNNTTLPLSMIYNIVVKGSNVCSLDGSPGGNESPELSWRNAPRRTRSFVVMAFDVTASFTHWGMYNIAPTATGLPEDAGVAGSKYGTQIYNDYPKLSYDGPCPPKGVSPVVHRYVFTVYALDKKLFLPSSSSNFPAGGETLLFALTKAERFGHVLASASITGLYSTTPPPE
jgi:Raf kinase inhibitor-like YbhB/YbcL family protein